MATGAEWSCPICREASDNIAYVGSCLHQFCRACIARWARKNPSCPLCRQTVHTIIYPASPDQGFMEMAVPQPSVSRRAGRREEPSAAEPQPQARVAGFPPETWALFFRNHSEILRPLEAWLNQVLCGDSWWDVAFAQGRIVGSLCRYGLHEVALVQELQPFLEEQTAAFVRHLIDVAADQCRELVRRRMNTAPQQAGAGAVASPSTGAQEERPEGPGQAGAGASGAGQSGGCGPGVFRQSGRRRGGGSEDT
ncbi:E3 ubiquitin-protein ligase Topors-like [Chamaea fasciata]|uniref:E3 ubiquitin-protein ligase Topors-like n=1 Tax=Chamaea fasciata TaxID=190680 RepID=UPI00336A9D4B